MADEEGKYTARAFRKLKLRLTGKNALQPLNQTLADWLTEELGRPVSNAKARKLLMAGAVYVNRRRIAIPSQMLSSGSTIEVSIDLAKLFGDSASQDKPFELTSKRILFEDEDLIVVDKPAGLPAHPTVDDSRDSLTNAISRFLSKRDGRESPYLGIHQRLDRDTSGIVLFTKSRRVNAAIGKSFANHEVMKVYNAITATPAAALRGKLKHEWTIRNYLGKVSSKSKRWKYGVVQSDGQMAETTFRVLGQLDHGLWIEAKPKTGRTHQIRVHLADFGLPILGDDLYGDGSAAPRLMLHAVEFVFTHPVRMQEIALKCPLPADFQRCLSKRGTGGQ